MTTVLGGDAMPMPGAAPAIVGREPELGRLEAFLDGIRDGPIALSLEGEIGIGKTTRGR